MRVFLIILSIIFFLFNACTRPPDTKLIAKDLGIVLPKKYKIISADSDPFGLGADTKVTYIFQFDSLSYQELVASIEGSVLFNTAAEKDFDTLPILRKRDIIKTLAQHEMTSYWIQTDSTYIYDGNELIINEPSNAYIQVFSRGTLLPNQKWDAKSDNGIPYSVYYVTATVDREKRTLFYTYVHI